MASQSAKRSIGQSGLIQRLKQAMRLQSKSLLAGHNADWFCVANAIKLVILCLPKLEVRHGNAYSSQVVNRPQGACRLKRAFASGLCQMML